MNLLTAILLWLNSEPAESIKLQRDGLFPFLSYADLNQPPQPLLTLPNISCLIILAVGVPVVFLA